MKKLILISVMFILGIAVGVSWAVPKYPNELLEFVKSAKDLSSALEAGVSYEQYGDIVVKLKVVANNAIEKLDAYDLPPKKWTQRRVGVSIGTSS